MTIHVDHCVGQCLVSIKFCLLDDETVIMNSATSHASTLTEELSAFAKHIGNNNNYPSEYYPHPSILKCQLSCVKNYILSPALTQNSYQYSECWYRSEQIIVNTAVHSHGYAKHVL